MLIDSIRQVVTVRGGPIADTFGDAFSREVQLSFGDLGKDLERLIEEDIYLFDLYFNRKFVERKPQ